VEVNKLDFDDVFRCLVIGFLVIGLPCLTILAAQYASLGGFEVTGVFEGFRVDKNNVTVLVINGERYGFGSGNIVGVNSTLVGKVVTLQVTYDKQTGGFDNGALNFKVRHGVISVVEGGN